jgi:2,3-bisphosphoglycerate-dependent phosphoglycerate mutase
MKLILVRHGESTWNQENRFTGWTDVDLSEKGVEEALLAGQTLKASGLEFDIAYTSVLKRAIRTWWITMDKLDRLWVPVERTWRLNERHYGNLQGLNKVEMVQKFGEDQVKIWRRSYAVQPPALGPNDPRSPTFDLRYKNIPKDLLPLTECLKDTVQRFLPFWTETLAPALQAGKRPIIFAHGNSIRALLKHVEGISDDDIVELNIPTAVPLLVEFGAGMKVIRREYLGDQGAIQKAIQSVANQTKK